jgi:hypothetical protein
MKKRKLAMAASLGVVSLRVVSLRVVSGTDSGGSAVTRPTVLASFKLLSGS